MFAKMMLFFQRSPSLFRLGILACAGLILFTSAGFAAMTGTGVDVAASPPPAQTKPLTSYICAHQDTQSGRTYSGLKIKLSINADGGVLLVLHGTNDPAVKWAKGDRFSLSRLSSDDHWAVYGGSKDETRVEVHVFIKSWLSDDGPYPASLLISPPYSGYFFSLGMACTRSAGAKAE